MKFNSISLIAIFLLILTSCKKKNEVNRIVFATTGCFGECGAQVIEIDSTLQVKYHGYQYADSLGYFKSSISQEFWEELNEKARELQEKMKDTLHRMEMVDSQNHILILYSEKKEIKRIENDASESSRMNRIDRLILKELKKMKLVRTQDSSAFISPYEVYLIPKPTFENKIRFTADSADNTSLLPE